MALRQNPAIVLWQQFQALPTFSREASIVTHLEIIRSSLVKLHPALLMTFTELFPDDDEHGAQGRNVAKRTTELLSKKKPELQQMSADFPDSCLQAGTALWSKRCWADRHVDFR